MAIRRVTFPIKRVTFHGDSLDRLRDFPEDARREAGHELIRSRRVAIPVTGSRCQQSARELARSESGTRPGAYRVIYIATFADAVHVLHAFEKRTQKTARPDLELAAARLRQLKRGSE
jgi:phage-related protein